MSAKGRGEHRGGDLDFYPTPAWCVDRLLDDCGEELLLNSYGDVLEPTVGDGAIVRACTAWLDAAGTNEAPAAVLNWTGVELRRGGLDPRTQLRDHVEGVDFRSWEPPSRFALAIGNPPYNVAESIIRRCLGISDVVCMLLHLGFLGSDERVDFFRGIGSDFALRILPERPSFDGEGTDSIPSAWYVWNHPGIRGVKLLDTTPAGVRRAQKPQALEFNSRQVSIFDRVGT